MHAAGERGNEILIRDLRVMLEEDELDPSGLAAQRLGLAVDAIVSCQIVRRSLDARRGRPRQVLTLRARLAHPPARLPAGVQPAPADEPLAPPPRLERPREVVVVGTGPAGLFCALRLCEAGLTPVLVDRGRALHARTRDVGSLLSEGILDPESNFHFGLGGAGTYTDGKLFTRLHQPAVRYVLETFFAHGAGSRERILVDSQPHVGSDRWPPVIERMRTGLEERGCSFRLGCRVTGIEVRAGRLVGMRLDEGLLECEAAVLAAGNSARELFEALPPAMLAAKPFAVGLRMTHPQELIDHIQYGRAAGHPKLPPASYRLTANPGGRGVYTFCMCPGGVVVPTPTEPGRLALNGMSNAARSSGEANAAVVAGLRPADLDDPRDPLCGLRFQRTLEEAAYAAGGGGYQAPAQALGAFLQGASRPGKVRSGYRPGVRSADVGALLPTWLTSPLRAGLAEFFRRMPGLDDPRAVVLGLETRTSSPVRILRDERGTSPAAEGLFPAGEGSGYAGGIVSSAVDGIQAADNLVRYLQSRT